MKKAILRVTGRWAHRLTARVRSGEKGMGKVLGKCSADSAVWSSPLFRLAEKVALEHGVKVLVETFTGVYENCVVVPLPGRTGCVHLPNRSF